MKVKRFFGLELQPCLGSWQCMVGFGLQPAMVQLCGETNAFGSILLSMRASAGMTRSVSVCVRGCFTFSICLCLVVPSQQQAVMVTVAT